MRAPKFLLMTKSVSAQLADAAGNAGRLRRDYAAQRRVAQFFDVAFERLQHHDAFHLRYVVRGVADLMAVRLELVVVPRGRRLDDIGKLARQIFRRIALEVVLRRAVLDVAASAGSVKIRRMRLGDADDIGSHVEGDGFDVARHRRGIVHRDFLRIDFAVARPVDHVGQKMSAIGEMVGCRDSGQGIFGDGVAIPVEQRFAELAALIFRMRRLVHIDVDMLPTILTDRPR